MIREDDLIPNLSLTEAVWGKVTETKLIHTVGGTEVLTVKSKEDIELLKTQDYKLLRNQSVFFIDGDFICPKKIEEVLDLGVMKVFISEGSLNRTKFHRVNIFEKFGNQVSVGTLRSNFVKVTRVISTINPQNYPNFRQINPEEL